MRLSYTNSLAFTVGLVIMGIEMTATRFVAPYFGTSTFVWTNVIAVIMIAMALGYWSGGKLAQRQAPLRSLQFRLFLAALFMAAIPFLVAPLTNWFLLDLFVITSGSVAILIGSFILVVMLFFIPAYLLAMTSPFLVGYETRSGRDAGRSAGDLFAIGTIGSIIGTFLAPLILVPTLGSKRTMLLFAALLFFFTLPSVIGRKRLGQALIIPFLFLPFGVSPQLRWSEYLTAQAESPYQYIQVFDIGGIRRLVFNEGGGTQSMYKPNAVLTSNNYWEVMAMTPSLFEPEKPLNILILGLAGGTISREIDLLYPERQISMTGVEIDPKVVELSSEYFDLQRDRLEVVTMDARAYLRTTDELFDIIVIDAYSNQLYLPSHMVTQEFFKEVRSHLTKAGLVALNINARDANSELLRTIGNTLVTILPATYRVRVASSWNYVMIGRQSAGELTFTNVPESLTGILAMVDGSFAKVHHAYDVETFTDDWAPTEQMIDMTIWQVARE